MRFPRLFIVLLFALSMWTLRPIDRVKAADLPPCDERLTAVSVLDSIAVDESRYCLERVIDASALGELAFTAIAAGDEGTLYAARPLMGEVYALVDQDADGLPETSEQIINGLMLPNALAYADGFLYIAGGDSVYRWRDGTLETLTEALSQDGTGLWTGGLTVSDDGDVFIGLGANCDLCEPDEGRGVIWRLRVEGDVPPEIVARGLRFPQTLAVHAGNLWIGDVTHDVQQRGRNDELNQLALDEAGQTTSEAIHFGWPYCLGDNTPVTDDVDWQFSIACETAEAPVYTLPSHSTPTSLRVYASDTFPWLQGKLLIALGGSSTTDVLEGYAIISMTLDGDGLPVQPEFVLPFVGDAQALTTDRSVNRSLQFDGRGFWPHHLYDLAVSPEGWIYFSVGGGRIYVLRPR